MPFGSPKTNNSKLNILKMPINISSVSHLLFAILFVWIAFISVLPISVAGIQLFAIYFTGASVLFVITCLIEGIKKTRVAVITFTLIVAFCTLASIAKDWSLFDSVYGILLYALPIFLIFLPSLIELSLERICFFIQLMTIAASLVSLLVVLGFIDSGIDGYNITIMRVDNTIGLIGLAVSFYLLNVKKSNKIFAWITVALSLFIIITGQSRARMVYAALIIAAFTVYMIFFAKKSRIKNAVVLICAAVVTFLFFSAYSTALQNYLSFVVDKFGELGEDISTTYRQDEMRIHLQLFNDNFWFGIGSGALNNEYTTSLGETIYGHNMITGAFAFEGIFYGLALVCVLIYALARSIYRLIKTRTPSAMLCATMMVLLITLSITSGGFSKLGTHAGALVVGVILSTMPAKEVADEDAEEKE